ncbi:MAG: GH92 family glycosyl hydrolase [bacterium]|nr:GH92 family glycosyl hydrolase [bacterium]
MHIKPVINLQSIFVSVSLIFAHFDINAQTNYANLVNPFVGTGGHGHTFPGPTVPFGMVQVGPDTRIDGSWDGCSGYHHSDSIIYGFSHTHLSGTGCSDFGDVMLMPTQQQNPAFKPSDYASTFSHTSEKASAGYYEVTLQKNNIDVALTASTRVGFHQYTFPQNGIYQVVLDLLHRDKLLDGNITQVNKHTIKGFRRSEAWAKDQRVYFYIEFSKDFTSIISNNSAQISTLKQENLVAEKATQSYFNFNMKKDEKLWVKVGISSVDEEGARKNMVTEIPHWNFEQTRQEAEALWNKELSKIEIKGGTAEQRTIFYTALYHCFIHPSIANDVDGRYLGRDFKVYQTNGFNYYSVFSLWDTFRALHPLFNLVQRERNIDFIKTFLAQYQQVGRMPMWELGSNETDCMIGYHSVSVIADALAKGNNRFNPKLAMEATLGTAKNHKYGASVFHQKGFLSVEDEHESVSKTLEYSYNDWAVSEIAKYLDPAQAKKLSAQLELNNWQHIYNAKTAFMQPRMNGGWYSLFNPKEVNNNYTEANAWQYSFFVPQDVPGLISAMGGKIAFEKKLDELFQTSSKTSGREQADITGLIGQYAHGNEPSHHMAYLYNYVDKPEKTHARVKQILQEMYHNAPDGLAGNEDCGQMSAWYVFSAMGFYPVTPGLNSYELGAPLFNEVTIKVNKQTNILKFPIADAQRLFVEESIANRVDCKNTLSKNTLSKIRLSKNTLSKNTLSKITEFADGYWGNEKVKYHFHFHFPDSNITRYFYFDTDAKPIMPNDAVASTSKALPSPIIETANQTFRDSLRVTIYPNFYKKNLKISYEIADLENKIIERKKYNKPFYIHQSSIIHAKIEDKNLHQSFEAHGKFYYIAHNWDITLGSTYNNLYTAGGVEGLADGIYGDKDWRKGNWQGYYGSDFIATIDLKKEQEISSIYANFLQDQSPWILMPPEVLFYGSNDGVNFNLLGNLTHDVPENYDGVIIKKIELNLPNKIRTKYVKIVAKNYGKLPKWHISAGEQAFIFVDEIGVK